MYSIISWCAFFQVSDWLNGLNWNSSAPVGNGSIKQTLNRKLVELFEQLLEINGEANDHIYEWWLAENFTKIKTMINLRRFLDLCGSSVSFNPVRQVLCHCSRLRTLNLSSCRALPRGIKRLYDGVTQLTSLRTAIEAGRFDDNDQGEDWTRIDSD